MSEINFNDRQARFIVIGVVHKTYAAPNGKFAKLTVLVPNQNNKDCRYEIKAFDSALIRQIADVGAGQSVRCAGSIDITPLKNKDKAEIKVDGYSVWQPEMVLRKLDVEQAKEKTAGNPFKDDSDGVPF